MRNTTLVCAALLAAVCSVAKADVLLTHYVAYTQNFDTLANTGTSSTMPANWSFSETGVSANTTYAAGTGSSATSNTYSYGATSSTERALGELTATSVVSTFGAGFMNNGPTTMTKILDLSYTGEQWRLGATGRVDALDFQISFDATSLTTGTWSDLNFLDFIAPVTTGTTGALDGNANFTNISSGKFTLATPVAPGSSFWIRWTPRDATGADDGLGIDNFSITAIPEPSSMALCGIVVGCLGVTFARRRKKAAA